MRATALVLGTAVLLVLGAHVLAGADEPARDAALQRRVEVLEGYVEYLRSREAALTGYLLANEGRAADLEALADQAAREGFTARSIPAASRETLLAGLRAMAASLREGLPAPTPEERQRLKRIEALAKAGGG